jgi:hypothetical protein
MAAAVGEALDAMNASEKPFLIIDTPSGTVVIGDDDLTRWLIA